MSAITTELQLRVSGVADSVRQLNEVGRASGNMRREFMAGQRLQGGVTNLLGINNGLTQAIDGFERLQFMAEQSGMSTGKYLGKIAADALTTAGALAALTIGYQKLSEAASEFNSVAKATGDSNAGNATWWKLFLYGPSLFLNPGNEDAAWKGLGLGNPTAGPRGMTGEQNAAIRGRIGDQLWKDQQPKTAADMWREFVAQRGTLTPLIADQLRQVAPILIKDFQAQEKTNRFWSSLEDSDDPVARFAKVIKDTDTWKSFGETDIKRFGALQKGFEERDKFREEYRRDLEKRYNEGPQYAGVTLAGSHQARLDAAGAKWDSEMTEELKTANDYLATIAVKVGSVQIYGIN